MANAILSRFGEWMARVLTRERDDYQSFAVVEPELLAATLQPCDVVLVEGSSRVAAAIKWLTHSNWSHAAFFAGDVAGGELIEADLVDGVRRVGLDSLAGRNTRICRPVGLTDEDAARVVAHMRASLGRRYDLRNVFDLARYFLPNPPVPRRWRRRMLALGSGDPTRAICSTLIAEAFQSVRYPILPIRLSQCPDCCKREVLHIRHHSLFAPRDFDLSPYFRIVKPTIEQGFDYRALEWDDLPARAPARPALLQGNSRPGATA